MSLCSFFCLGVLFWLHATGKGSECPLCAEHCKEKSCEAGPGEKCGYGNVRCRSGLVCKRRLGMILGEERAGLCEPEDCKHIICCYRQICGYFNASSRIPECGCPRFRCSGKLNEVCGFNGRTYSSVCALQRKECRACRFIGLNHMGKCAVPPTATPTPATPTHADTKPCFPVEDDPFAVQLRALKLACPSQRGSAQINKDPFVETPVRNKRFPECVHNNKILKPFKMVQFPEEKPCIFRTCNIFSGRQVKVVVPGCPGYAPERDFNVTSPPIHGSWSQWTAAGYSDSNSSCPEYSPRRRRTCTDPAPSNEGLKCTGIDSYQDAQPCNDSCGCTCKKRSMPVDYIRASKLPNCHTLQRKDVHYCWGGCPGATCCRPEEMVKVGRLQCVKGGSTYSKKGLYTTVNECECVGSSCTGEHVEGVEGAADWV